LALLSFHGLPTFFLPILLPHFSLDIVTRAIQDFSVILPYFPRSFSAASPFPNLPSRAFIGNSSFPLYLILNPFSQMFTPLLFKTIANFRRFRLLLLPLDML